MRKVVIRITNRVPSGRSAYPWIREKEIRDIPPQKLAAILINNLKQSFDEVELIGSGTLLHPEFETILKLAAKTKPKSLTVDISGSDIAKIGKLLKKNGATHFKTRLAGIDQRSHDAVFGKGSFSEFRKNLSVAHTLGVPLTAEFNVCKNNWNYLPHVLRMGVEDGFAIHFAEMMPLGEFEQTKDLLLSKREAELFWNFLRHWGEQGIAVFGHSNILPNQKKCEYSQIIFLDEAGNFGTCPLDSCFLDKKKKNNFRNLFCNECFQFPAWQGKEVGAKKRKSSGRSEEKQGSKRKMTKTSFDLELVNEIIGLYNSYSDKPGLLHNAATLEADAAALIGKDFSAEEIKKIERAYGIVSRMSGLRVNWLENYLDIPDSAYLEITEATDMRYAFRKKASRAKHLTLDAIRETLRNTHLIGTELVLCGGDLLKHPGIKDVLDYIGREQPRSAMLLDGWNFNERKTALRNLESFYYFELFGSTAYTHDKHTGREGSFDRIMEAMEFLLENDKQIGVQYVLTSKNSDELEQMMSFCGMLDIPRFQIVSARERFSGVTAGYRDQASHMARARRMCGDSFKKQLRLSCHVLPWKTLSPEEIKKLATP